MPRKRIPPTAKIDNEIKELKYSVGEESSPKDLLGKIIHLGMRRIIHEMLEQEVKEFTGHGYYEHGAMRNGYRNGYEPSTLKTAEGRLIVERPQVRDENPAFESKMWPHIKKHIEQLEKMVVEIYARGCSTRDIEDLLKDDQGRLLLSKRSVSILNERLWDEYQAFCQRNLKDYDVVYIFVDAVYEPLRFKKSRQDHPLAFYPA